MKSIKSSLPLLVVIALGIVADVYLFNTTYHPQSPATSTTSILTFPERIGNVTVLKAYVGNEGIEKIKSIHWDPEALKGLVNGAVVIYSDGSIAWIAELKSPVIAKKLEDEMVNRIAQLQGKLPYGTPIPHQIGNTTFYIIPDVRDRVHILWREGRYLIWLELGSQGVKVLNAYIKYYWGK
ncbi:hypothetical protein IPA_00920 [Ignicoccus pacificus DSM 13166]|uniref:Uncharacterized protein n=1 Tax=Ignicoccus pacificus DSM 13166 TaxID=940294 RepID=A0A977KAE3_9CREN|nr:hypothetical protein IPA_00920 [Ignicoccus pacificus DSM 13166]